MTVSMAGRRRVGLYVEVQTPYMGYGYGQWGHVSGHDLSL